MSKYADVYLLPIAEDKVAEYKKIATMAGGPRSVSRQSAAASV